MAKKKKKNLTFREELDIIVPYNRANNTNFFKVEQVEQHKKDMKELAKLQADYDKHAEK